MTTNQPFYQLTPDEVLGSLEALGWRCDGRLLVLNSYENRVYQVWLDDKPPIVVKYYRPERWSDQQILEEHEFTLDLAAAEIPVVAPLQNEKGKTLHYSEHYRLAVYPCRGGRAPELDQPDNLRWIGRFMGRIHQMGRQRRFQHRPTLSIERLGQQSRDFLLQNNWIPDYLRQSYEVVSEQVLQLCERAFATAGEFSIQAIHGDCHPGNILWTDKGPHFVDFDDAVNGPIMQDIWMLLGESSQIARHLDIFLEGYQDFADFEYQQLILIEPLRSLRMLHYSAWLARRWEDPAFPFNFSWFAEPRYWEQHVNDLQQQVFLLQEAPMSY